MKVLISITAVSLFFATLIAEDTVTLKSGRKIEGTVVVKGNEVHLTSKYGTIIYNAADVKIEKATDQKSLVSEVADKTVAEENSGPALVPVTGQVITRSGRKLVGSIYQKGNETYLVDLGGPLRIDPFVLSKKEGAEQKIIGEVISGEKCNVVLKSGRSFSGIVDEIDDVYFVTSVIGTVKVEKKDLDHIEKTGFELNIKEELEKISAAEAPKVVPVVVTPAEAQPKTSGAVEMSLEEIARINKKAEDSLKAAQETQDNQNCLRS